MTRLNSPVPTASGSRFGVSPIGTVSPNTSANAATNSSYSQGAFASGIASQSGTIYTVNNSDYQGIVLFNSASAIQVVLNSAVQNNFQCNILNTGAGQITLLPNGGYLVNGTTQLTLAANQGCSVYFADRAWTAFIGSSVLPVVPKTTNALPGEYFTGYNASDGLFATNTTAGVSGTISLASLTSGGAQGSITVTDGLITGFVNPT